MFLSQPGFVSRFIVFLAGANFGWGFSCLEGNSPQELHSCKVFFSTCIFFLVYKIFQVPPIWIFPWSRSARALVEAEAELENEEKLGEAAMHFFYGTKVTIFNRMYENPIQQFCIFDFLIKYLINWRRKRSKGVEGRKGELLRRRLRTLVLGEFLKSSPWFGRYGWQSSFANLQLKAFPLFIDSHIRQ